MKVVNPLQVNNWPIKKLLIIILASHLLFWGSIGLDSIGFKIPIFRQLVCFMYLTFVPGILILRVLRLHKFGCIENLLYSVGLSLSFLMFVGFFMNTLYPLIGISKPISIIPLMVTVSFITLILCGICYLVDRDFLDTNLLYQDSTFSASSLFMCLIPIWVIVGTYLVNFYDNNFLLMFIIFFISLIIVLVSFDHIPSNLYPLAIFITSFSLLFHSTLISTYISGWDIHEEYFLANRVITNSLWNSGMFSNINSMLSIVMLAPIYSILSNLTLTWVFKIIYPAIFSLTSLGLYLIFKKQTTDKIAFMSVFFFISNFTFFTEMTQLARQQVAEYFFILILLLLIQKQHCLANKFLLILFSFSMIVSHYGVSYLVIPSLVLSLILLIILHIYFADPRKNTISLTLIVLVITFLLAWYMYTSTSLMYDTVHLIRCMSEDFVSDFLNPDKSQGAFLIKKQATSFLHEFAKYMHIFAQFCISIGLYFTIKKAHERTSNFSNEYLSLCVVFYSILIAAIAVPNFSSALNTSRLYHIALILLSPFCVIGGIILSRILLNRISYSKTNEINELSLKILSIFFAAFLLFNTGWIYEVAGDSPTSFSLNNTLDFPKFNDRDIAGCEWLYQANEVEESNRSIYADSYRWLLFLGCFKHDSLHSFTKSIDLISKDSYLYFSTYNIEKNKILINNLNYLSFDSYISSRNQIYNNGGAKIYS